MSAAQELPLDQVSEPGTEVALLDRPLTGVLVFAPGAAASLIDAMVAKVRATEIDATTPKGRAACKSLARKVASSRVALDDMGKDLNAGLREQINRTDAERRVIRERLTELQAEVLAPVVAYEAYEEERVARLRQQVADLSWPAERIAASTVDQLAERLDALRGMTLTEDWREFRQKAGDVVAREITLTTAALEEAQKREAEAARIAAEQARAAEEARLEAERLRVEREARITAEAAEAARVAAEQEAERARLLALEEAEARELASREAEGKRLAVIAAEHARQVEAAAYERSVAEREKLAAEQRAQRAEQERIAADERAAEAARQAEVDRVAAEDRAERQRLAAVAAERQRVAEELAAQQAAAAEREADKAHKAARNNEVLTALMQHAGLGKDSAKAVVVALASKQIPHTVISY